MVEKHTYIVRWDDVEFRHDFLTGDDVGPWAKDAARKWANDLVNLMLTTATPATLFQIRLQ